MAYGNCFNGTHNGVGHKLMSYMLSHIHSQVSMYTQIKNVSRANGEMIIIMVMVQWFTVLVSHMKVFG